MPLSVSSRTHCFLAVSMMGRFMVSQFGENPKTTANSRPEIIVQKSSFVFSQKPKATCLPVPQMRPSCAVASTLSPSLCARHHRVRDGVEPDRKQIDHRDSQDAQQQCQDQQNKDRKNFGSVTQNNAAIMQPADAIIELTSGTSSILASFK